jgi:arylsulfatase A-like enzyme
MHMRILYIDIDSQRPDHLGCYGYHRNTSPNIDRIASQGVRFDNYYVSDAPCLPSRTALWSGRFGIHNGVINHGGAAAEPFQDGIERGFRSTIGMTNWMWSLRQASKGMRTVTISPFGEPHSAFHWYAGFTEIYNTGKGGAERADEIAPLAIDWIKRNGREENWFLHVNLWDPHTPYRTPASFGNPFEGDALPAWYSEDVRSQHWQMCGPHSAREVGGFGIADYDKQLESLGPGCWPSCVPTMDDARKMFDGYDCGVRYADEWLGKVFNALADQSVLDDTAIVISADHGENLGELNIYGDHQTADHPTCRVPLIMRWPGVTKQPRVDSSLRYHFDFAATTIELLGGTAPVNWDGRSFADALQNGAGASARDFLVISQGAWSCQRGVRFGDWMCVRSYHDGYHGFPDVMLFNLRDDPHQQRDVAEQRPEVVGEAMSLLDRWYGDMMRTATHGHDPMWTVMHEGGSFHTRRQLREYIKRLRETGRSQWAQHLAERYPRES